MERWECVRIQYPVLGARHLGGLAVHPRSTLSVPMGECRANARAKGYPGCVCIPHWLATIAVVGPVGEVSDGRWLVLCIDTGD